MKYVLIFLVFYPFITTAQDLSLYQKEIFVSSRGNLPYRLLKPAPFNDSTQYPLIIFLHGAFEKGTDNHSQLRIGGAYFLQNENRANFPSYVLFPQCAADDSWAYFENEIDPLTGKAGKWKFPFGAQPTPTSSLLLQLVDSLSRDLHIDRNRIYIGGLSQGAMGVFDIVARRPDLFAAAFPICGAGNTSTAKLFADKVSLWIFHGTEDQVIPPAFSREFYRKLKRMGADVRNTEYEGVGHDSWTPAFAEKGLMPWMFSKRKKNTD